MFCYYGDSEKGCKYEPGREGYEGYPFTRDIYPDIYSPSPDFEDSIGKARAQKWYRCYGR